MENEQAKFTGWAIVEMMGHQREAGYVTTESYGLAVLFRVDVPELPERDYVLERPAWDIDNSYLAAGSKVRRGSSPARSRLISPAAVYAINPCTEAAARKAIEAMIVPRLLLLEAPTEKQLPAGGPEERTFPCCGNTIERGHIEGCQAYLYEQEDDDDAPIQIIDRRLEP